MAMQWLHRLWHKLKLILRHPWHSLVSLLAAVGHFILSIPRFLVIAALWTWQKLKRVARIRLWSLFKGFAYAAIGLCVLAFLITLVLINYPTYKVPDYQPVDQHVYLSQGWGWTGGQNEPLRQLFYFTPQGASVKDLRYSWFVNLEVPWGKKKFTDPERMSAYGFLVDQSPTTLNPDRLPVGFTSHYDPRFGENLLDLTCAACHTGELTVNKNGKRYGLRVDGGPAMHAFTAMHIGDFAPELLGALTSTYLNPFKFARFARPVLGPAYPQGRWKLHHDLGLVIGELLHQAWNDKSKHLYPTEEGPGRIDALGRIANTVFGDELSPLNYKVSNAPVRYPPLWDIWKFDHVQYNASVRQPMTRNVSESLGTGASAQLLNAYGSPIPEAEHFDTSVMIDNLAKLEMGLWSLEPPKWNEDCMGKIDWDKARKGQAIFENTCQHCHGPFPASEPIKEWYAYLKTPGYKDQVMTGWQNFMDALYQAAPAAPVPAPDVEDRDVKTQEQPRRKETTRQSNNETQVGMQPSPSEQHDLTLHRERSSLEVAASRPSQPKSAPSSSSPGLVSSFQPLRKAAGGEETTEGNLRPAPEGPSAKGSAPRVYSDLPLWIMHPLSVEQIGTDPTTAVNFIDKKIDLSTLGLSPAIADEGMRTLLEEDLIEETDAYAKEILRLTGVNTGPMPQVNQLSAAERYTLRNRALAIAGQADPVAKNPGDQNDLKSDIAVFQDAISAGPARINNFLASMDLSGLNTGVALRLIVFRTRQRFYDQRNYQQPERNLLNGFGELDVPVPLPQYKPRPLAGIWAAGPFLHNGSVPTIYQLLLPADQRDKKFFVGTRDFDAVNLGLSTQPPVKGGFWLDTSITGNSNGGHEFRKGYVKLKEGSLPQYGVIGPELTNEQRQDVIEYLKVHRDEHSKDPVKDLDGYLREGLDTINVCQ
jgi:mono/diheme cytochrome c family protein